MPMIPVSVDSSTLATTSVVMSVITFGFCAAMGLKPGASLVIGAVVGIVLYSLGIIPVGMLAVVGFAMIVSIFKTIFGGKKPPQYCAEAIHREAIKCKHCGSEFIHSPC